MERIPALAAALAFLVSFDQLRVVEEARRAVRAGQAAGSGLRDRTVSDAEKERLARAASMSLLGSFVSILVKGSAAIVAATAVLVASQLLGVGTVAESTRWLMSWPAIVGLTASVVILSKLRPGG